MIDVTLLGTGGMYPLPERFEAELNGIFAGTIIARDGQTATLQFRD